MTRTVAITGVGGGIGRATAAAFRADGWSVAGIDVRDLGDDIALDVVAGSARPFEAAPVLSNSFGFGGHNATLVLAPVS